MKMCHGVPGIIKIKCIHSIHLLVSFMLCFTSATTPYKLTLKGKPADQSSTLSGLVASIAIDEQPFLQGWTSCTHTQEEAKAWWRINLQQEYAVQNITLYNRRDAWERLQKLNITVGYNADFTRNALCAFFDGPVPSEGNSTIQCTSTLRGIYVTIQKTNRSTIAENGQPIPSDGYLTLCEVEIYGYRVCTGGRFGENCTSCNCTGSCDMGNGKCNPTCVDGKRGDTCQEDVTCSSPGDVANAALSPKSILYQYNAKVIYTCTTGYTIYSGSLSLTCGVGGHWIGTIPTCGMIQDYCNPAPDVQNAYRETRAATNYPIGSSLIFTCNTGYTTDSGNTTRECIAADALKGRWSGANILCEKVNCGYPGDVEHATVMVGNDYTFGGKIKYKCEPGYGIRGNAEITCNADRIWSGPKPSCLAITCQNPGQIRYAESDDIGKNSFEYKASITYKCSQGYQKKSGNETRICVGSGSWSGVPLDCVRTIISKEHCIHPEQPAIQSALATYDSGGKTTFITVTWKEFSQEGHNCNNYTKFEILYTSEMDPKETIPLSMVNKLNSQRIDILFPRRSEYQLVVRVYNDAGLSSSSRPFSVDKYQNTTEGTPNVKANRCDSGRLIGVPIACLFIGAAVVLFVWLTVHMIKRRRDNIRKYVSHNHSAAKRGPTPKLSDRRGIEPSDEIQLERRQTSNSGQHDKGKMEHTYDTLDPQDVSSQMYQNVTSASSRAPMYESLSK